MMSRVICSGVRRFCSGRPQQSGQKVYVAFGANVGDRVRSIHEAIHQMGYFGTVTDTSFLYESLPMYKTDQPKFLNGIIQFYTQYPPLKLLSALKEVEVKLGRNHHAERNSPRPIDLDIVTYGNNVFNDNENNLTIPHGRLEERHFVLKPLCDLDPHLPIPSPMQRGAYTAEQLLNSLQKREPDSGLTRVTPLPNGGMLEWGSRTLLMGILNLTPDSFSDGGQFNSVDQVLRQVETFISHGFDIIDIGGQSTRPGAQCITAEEELHRVLPTILKIVEKFPQVNLSIDTFHSRVAESALSAGVQIVNDVSAGGDEHMHPFLARTRAPTIQMHMRGDSDTMQTLTQYADGDIAQIVASELRRRISSALRAGVARWNIIADCGIGFAKTRRQNFQLFCEGATFQRRVGGFPCVLGLSRKSWMNGVIDRGIDGGIESRDWASAGAIGLALAFGGVDLVRVHNARIADAVRACDAIRNQLAENTMRIK